MQKIKSKLNIKDIGNEFIVTLKRPYIVSRKYRIERGDEKTIYWGLKGEQREFLRRLSICTNFEDLRESGLIDSQGKKQIYKYYVDLLKFRNEFKYEKVDKLIELFNLIKIIGMIEDIKFEVTLNNGKTQDINDFSDGQFQSIYLFALMESFQDRNCITLLDEPDSFLHPEWQYEFLKQTKDVSIGSVKNNHVLLSSHSPSTIAGVDKNNLKSFELENGTIMAKNSEKNEIIKSLSSGLITYTENDFILSISNFVRNTFLPILFTEGISDELILEEAWNKLYPNEERPFCINNAFDRIFLRNLFSRDEFKKNYNKRLMFALFDFDEAYDDWNGLKKEKDVNINASEGLSKKLTDANHFAFLLPVPNNEEIRKQVLNAEGQPWGKGIESHLSIELLFFKEELIGRWFKRKEASGGAVILEFTSDKHKMDFAKKYIPTLKEEDFEIFRPMFEFIRNKCANETL